MSKVAVVGAGMTRFGEHFALGIRDLLPMAFAECAASADKGIEKTDVQAAWFGSLGLPDLPVTRVENSINQVDGARSALAHNIGGPTVVSAVTILEGPAIDGN